MSIRRPELTLPGSPLFGYLVRDSQRPTLKATLGLVVALGSMGAVVMLLPAADLHQMKAPVHRSVLLGLAWLVIILMPSVMATLAVLMTIDWSGSSVFHLLCLSHLTRRELVRTHIASMLFKLRVLGALAIGLTPVLFAGMFRRTLVWSIGPYGLSPFAMSKSMLRLTPMRLAVWRVDRIGWTPQFYGWVIGTWGMLLLGVVIGAGLALRLKKQTPALIAAGPLMLLLTLIPLAAIPCLPLEQLPVGLGAAITLVLAVMPGAVAGGMLRHIARWV